jgi:hypothetical protein
MTEILRFEMNVPAEVALKYAGPGKPIEGRYGNRVMYTLADNRVMYVAPIVASRITDLGLQPGERFQVRKQLRKQGQRRLIEWEVQRLESDPETQLEQELRESIEVIKAAQAKDASEGPDLQPVTQEQPALSNSSSIPTIAPVASTSGNSKLPSAHGNSSPTVMDEREDAPETVISTADHAGRDLGCNQERAVPSALIATPTLLPKSNGSTTNPHRPLLRMGTAPLPLLQNLSTPSKQQSPQPTTPRSMAPNSAMLSASMPMPSNPWQSQC